MTGTEVLRDRDYSGLSAYGVENSVEAIQKEVMTYGPVEVAFEVYEDFFHYSEGVYVVSRRETETEKKREKEGGRETK